MLSARLLRTSIRTGLPLKSAPLFVSPAIRSYSQVDYGVYNSYKEPFDELNELKKFRRYNRARNVKWFAVCFILGATISYNYSIHEIFQNSFHSKLPTNQFENAVYLKDLEDKLKDLQMVKDLDSNPNFVKLNRNWLTLTDLQSPLQSSENGNVATTTTIHSTLATPGSIAIPPLTYYNESENEYQTFIHLGQNLTGYPFIVHGGIISLIVDEIFKYNYANSHNSTDISHYHTKNLSINYSLPTLSNNFIVVKSKVDLANNSIEGCIESTNGTLLTKASATYVNDRIQHGNSVSTSEKSKSKGWFWM